MDWTKIKTKHFLYSDLPDSKLGALTKLLCLTAHLETMPTISQMHQVCSQSSLKMLSKYFHNEGKSLKSVLEKVLEDVSKLNHKKMGDRIRQADLRKRKGSVNTRDVTHDVTHDVERKRREEKKREDITKRFAPPESDEVLKYFQDPLRLSWESSKFYDFYTSKGWMVGKNKMKDWKAAARNWAKTARERSFKTSGQQVVERPDRQRNNAPESVKPTKEPHPVRECTAPPPEFRKMINKLAAEKGV